MLLFLLLFKQTEIFIAETLGEEREQVIFALAEGDRRVLQELYAVTGGEQWTRKRGWMSAAPISGRESPPTPQEELLTYI